MFYVYLLKSDKTDRFYIGYTDNLEIRLAKHNQGEVKSTSPFRPWRIVYYEAYQSEEDAVDREKALKYFGKALGQLKRRIKRSIT